MKIEIRTDCKICGKKLGHGLRTFCSPKCRGKNEYQKQKEYQKQYTRDKRGKHEKGKLKCMICNKWYFRMGNHVWQAHDINIKNYRKRFKLSTNSRLTT